MSKFRTVYGDHNKSMTCCGDKYAPEYELFVDEYGREELKEVGKTDLQAYIQSHKDSVDFNLIIQRYQMGDLDALEKLKGFYADVSSIPVSLSEIMNMNIRGQKLFESLPVEVKKLYNNNYLDFLSDPERINKLNKKTSVPDQKQNVSDQNTISSDEE